MRRPDIDLLVLLGKKRKTRYETGNANLSKRFCHPLLLAFPILPSCFGRSTYVSLHFASNLVEENRSVLPEQLCVEEALSSRGRNPVKRRKRMRKQILFIHGAGNQHKPLGSGKLVASLQQQLGSDYQVLAPDMLDPDHPRYLAWRNQIEQELGKLDADGLLIGHSLGGSMLLKYLAEGTDLRPIAGMFLVAVPYAVPDDFASHLPPIRHLFLYHSRSDEDVPFSSLRRYQEKLPQATVRVLDGKEHSFTEGLPLLVQDIKRL
jgi:predicted alpha/beta hydrolase family esterase